MPALATALDARSPEYAENRAAMLPRLGWLADALGQARHSGGSLRIADHHAGGRLLARERIELLVDRATPLLELSPTAGWGTDSPVGAGVVTAIGIVEGAPCVIVANEPTVRGGAINPYTVLKSQRAVDIALANRLPLVNLVESVGPQPLAAGEPLDPGRYLCSGLTQLLAAGVTTVAAVFGEAVTGGAFVPDLCDHIVLVRDRARIHAPDVSRGADGPHTLDLPRGADGPHTLDLPRGADGPRVHNGSRGADGPRIHNGARPTAQYQPPSGQHPPRQATPARLGHDDGPADVLAEDDRDAVRLVRSIIARLARRPIHPWALGGAGEAPQPPKPRPPRHDPAGLLAVVPAAPQLPVDPHEVLARILDGSWFDEFKPDGASRLCAGWGTLHGYPLAVLADGHGRPSTGSGDEARKARQFVALANASGTPLLFLCDAAAPPRCAEGERPAAARYASLVMDAAAGCLVPHVTVHLGTATADGDTPRFRFRWPSERRRPSDPTPPRPDLVEDDGVIDPRDTRTVLGLCLAVIANEQRHGLTCHGGVTASWQGSTACGFQV